MHYPRISQVKHVESQGIIQVIPSSSHVAQFLAHSILVVIITNKIYLKTIK